MSEIADSLVWGSVRTNGEKFYLLEARPEHADVWMPEGTVKWLVADKDNYIFSLRENVNQPVYKASHLVFGKDACVELLDDPQTSILVEYFSSEEDDIEGNPV